MNLQAKTIVENNLNPKTMTIVRAFTTDKVDIYPQ